MKRNASQQRVPYSDGQVLEPVIEGDRNVAVRGSDRRAELTDLCVLCDNVRPLILGHVAPKWAGQWIKQEGYAHGTYHSLGVSTKTQDLPKHYLFCRSCDQRLGDAERHLAYLMKGRESDLAAVGISLRLSAPMEPRLSGVQANEVMRALSGVALKMHLSPHQLYKECSLSREEVAELTAAIKADEFPRERFAACAYKLVNRMVPDANPRASLYMWMTRIHQGVLVHIKMAGWRVGFFIGPAARFRQETGFPAEAFVGHAPFWVVPAHELAGETELHGTSVRSAVQTRPILVGEPCPCGIGEPFGRCCAGRWLPASAHWMAMPALVPRSAAPEFCVGGAFGRSAWE